MADTISSELPPWLAQRGFLANSNAVSQELQAGLQYAQQQREMAQREKAFALQQQAFQLKQDAELDVSQGLVEMGQVVSDIAKTGDWTSPANKARFYETASKHPHVMKTPAFQSLEENFQLAEKAKATEALWSNRLETQQSIADARIRAQLETQQNRIDSILQMEGIKQEHRKEIETLRNEMQILRDSLKPTRPGEMFHDLSEKDMADMRHELHAAELKFQSHQDEKRFDAERKAIQEKYDAKRIARPTTESAPSAPQQQPAATDRVKVKSPDGKLFTVPADQLQNALDQGYQQVP